ncbi:MAG: hypothetical protein R6W90_17530, partial [Ignavibacteriaceae bacterium]
ALSTIPGAKGNGLLCCLLVPVASVLSLILHQKMNNTDSPYKAGQAILLGFLTGIFVTVFATFFEAIITLITRTNEFIESIPYSESMFKEMYPPELYKEVSQILTTVTNDIETKGFSLLYTITFFFGYLIVDSIFSILGGLLGLLIVNRKYKQQ